MGKNIKIKQTIMDKLTINLILSVSLLVLMSLGGCITSQPSKFYILTPINYDADKKHVDILMPDQRKLLHNIDISKKNALKNLTLGLGPVSIPKYLDRSQLVVRVNPNQIKLEDFHQWAGSPRDDIPAILQENLSTLLGIDAIYKYPWKSYANIDYQIVVDLLQLDGRPVDSVRLIARWEILKGDALQSVKSGKADFTEQVSGSGIEDASGNKFDSFAAAQSRALGQLSQIIALSLVELL